MLALLSLLATAARAERTWPVRDATTLVQVLAQAEAGDTVELEPGEYVFTTPVAASALAPLLIDKPLTLRSRDRRQPAVLRNDGASLLVAITSSFVTLADLVVGAQRSGADERSIDVLVGAGTQTAPANANAYYGGDGARKRNPLASSRSEILVARALHTGAGAADAFRRRSVAVGAEGAMRVLSDIKLENVDFGASRSGTNVGFARGSYAGVSIGRCTFGRDGAPHINALVSVGDAQFASLSVHGNTLRGDTHVLIGSPAVEPEALGLNYWGRDGTPHVFIGGTASTPETYCLDAECATLAPVVDADQRNAVYASLAAAFAAGVQNVLLTDSVELSSPVLVTRAGSTLQSEQSCNGAPLITVRAGGAIVSAGAALVGVRNVRLALVGAGAAGFVYTDGTAQRLNVARHAQSLLSLATDGGATGVVLFDGVSVMGDRSIDQVAVVLNAPKVRVELEDAVILQAQYGVVVHRGALVSIDSTFFASTASAVYAETVTHQAGLRVSGSTFIGCGTAAIELGSGASSNTLTEFYVSCSQFLFNARRTPIVAHDCAKKPTLCAANLQYNTIISDQPASTPAEETENTLAAAERRMLKLGANHVEHGRRRDDYVYFGEPTRQFALQDTQGRLSWVTGTLGGDAAATSAFLLASYAPLRAQCFEVDGVSPEAAVVSDVLEVRSDSLLHGCGSLAARFRIDDSSTLPASLAVYGLAHLGEHALWTRAVSTLHPAAANQATIESTVRMHSTDDDRHTHRIVVVALETLPEQLAAALESGAATTSDPPRVIARRLCAVCGGATLPSHLLDEYCGGTTDNVRSSFDDAYTDLGFGLATGAPRAHGASIYIYGDCETALCPVVLDQNENIEGTSSTLRGTLRQSAACSGQPLVRFAARSSHHSSLRYLVAVTEHDTTVEVDAPAIAAGTSGTPSIAYSTLSSGIALHSRNGGRIIGNDIGRVGEQHELRTSNDATTLRTDALIVEANRFVSVSLALVDAGEVRVDRNTFESGGAITGSGESRLTVTANENVATLAADGGAALIVLGNTLADGASVTLAADQTYVGTEGTLRGVHFTLADSARISTAFFDASSSLTIAAGAVAVLRDVHFDALAYSLHTPRAFAACEQFELSAAGIDIARSLIFDANGRIVLTLAEQHQLDTDPTLYWALDGSLQRCSDGAPPVRSEEFCGCTAPTPQPEPVVAVEAAVYEPPPVVKADADSKSSILDKLRPQAAADDEEEIVLDDDSSDDDTSSNTTLIVVLSILIGIVVICLIIGCCVAYNRNNTASAQYLASRAAASAHQQIPSAYDQAAEVDHLGAYGVRKRRVPTDI